MEQRPRGGRTFASVGPTRPPAPTPVVEPTPPPPGGLIVMVRADPAQAARVLADDLHAELAIGGAATEAALDRLSTRLLAATDLDGLAAAMRRAEAIRDDTRAAAAQRISAGLNTRLAIHPDTIRRAATELLAAEDALRQAQSRMDRRTTVLSQLRAAGVGAVAASAAAVGVLRSAAGGGAIAAAGIVAAAVVAASSGRRRRHLEVANQLDPLRHAVGVAHRRWTQVAGADSDPRKVDSLIHRYEPQHHVVAALVAESPAVRAVERMAVERRAAWVTAWRSATGDHAPLAERLTEVLRRPDTELWLSEGLDAAAPDTLVVASPYADLTDDRARDLHRRLLELPEGHRVIVVLAPDPEEPSGARLPGIGWVPAITAPGGSS